MTIPQSPRPDAIKTMVKTLRNPGPDARRYSMFFDSVADALESLSRSPLSGTGREEVDVPRFMEVVRSRWNYEPDQFNVIEQVLSDPECVAVLSLSHEAPAQEPVAWQYELADSINAGGGYCDWRKRITDYKPHVPKGAIRNLTPLYDAAPASHATREALEWIVEKDVYWTSRGDYSGSEIIKTSTSGNVLVRGAYGTKAIRALASREDRAQAGRAIAPIPADERGIVGKDGVTYPNTPLGRAYAGQPTADESAKPSRGTFLGYKSAEGHEMHCANRFCPHQAKCAKGCINQVARPLTPPDKTFPANGIKS